MIENFCELIRKIHENPLAPVKDLTIREFAALQEHVAKCAACIQLTNEVLEEYKDVPSNPNNNDGRWD